MIRCTFHGKIRRSEQGTRNGTDGLYRNGTRRNIASRRYARCRDMVRIPPTPRDRRNAAEISRKLTFHVETVRGRVVWVLGGTDGPGAILCVHTEQRTTRLQPSMWRLRGRFGQSRHPGGSSGGSGRGRGGGGRCGGGIGRFVVYKDGGDGIKEGGVSDGGPGFTMWSPVTIDKINAPPYGRRWRSTVVR